MQQKAETYLAKAGQPFTKLQSWFGSEALITDLICKLIVTFGVMLIVGGLYLMINSPAASSSQLAQAGSTQTAASIVEWIPGIPFYIGDVSNAGAVGVGLVSWVLGVDLMLIGLGFWVRSRLARAAGLLTFGLAAFFQFTRFLIAGVLGSPAAIVELCVDGAFVYFIFARFDSPKRSLISRQQIKT